MFILGPKLESVKHWFQPLSLCALRLDGAARICGFQDRFPLSENWRLVKFVNREPDSRIRGLSYSSGVLLCAQQSAKDLAVYVLRKPKAVV